MNNTEKKEKLVQASGKIATWLEGLGVPANWAKVGGGLIVGAIAGMLATCQSGCSNVTPEQIWAAHEAYHLVTGEKCVIERSSK